MAMQYTSKAIPEAAIPRASDPIFQHLLDTYASETNKVIAIWESFSKLEMIFRPHPRSMTVLEVMKHQLLSERRFFAEFLGHLEPAGEQVLPAEETPAAYVRRMHELAEPRLGYLANHAAPWWLETVKFFDVERTRIWIFWRRVLHTAHHRTQLSVYLRLLDRPLPPTYGPTANAKWEGADPTQSAAAANRK